MMRNKDVIIDAIEIKRGAETKIVQLRIELCKLEVLIDIRDLLNKLNSIIDKK